MENLSRELFDVMIENFALTEVEPLAASIDEEERFPSETVEKMAKVGLMGITAPVELGGAGGDERMYVRAVETLSRYCATTGVILSAHTSLCLSPIMKFGNDAQKEKYVPMLAGGKLGAFGLTEPNAGTDAGNQQTTAIKTEGGYILNGSKLFITNAGYADIYVVFAMTDKAKRTKGITAFIVEKNFKGFSTGKKEKKMGIRGSATCELIFENVFVPNENRLGEEGEGFKIAMATLDGGRIGIAAQALGIARGALEESIKYVKERKQFGKPLSAMQNTQFTIADCKTKVEAAKLLVYQAADAYETGAKDVSVKAAMAKLFAAETAMYVTTKAVQMHGGYGYTREYPVERMMRDAKITEIYEGTSEVQKMVISAALLK